MTLGAGTESAVISLFSRGDFSHAALCTTPYTIFESDGTNVVGNKILKIVGHAQTENEFIQLGKIPGEVASCAVYRHPDIGSISQDHFAGALRRTMTHYYGRDYSYMSRLGRMAKANRVFRWVIQKYCEYKDRQLSEHALPSVFCSELVAHFYDELGLPLFADGRPPDDVSPTDLTHSRLKPVSGVVVDPATLQGVPTSAPEQNAWLTALETHDPVANYHKSSLLIQSAFDKATEAVNAYKREAVDDTFTTFKASFSEVRAHVRRCALSGHAGCMQRAERLATRWTKLADKMPELVSIADNQDLPQMKSMLREQWLANRSLRRCEALLQSTRLRSIIPLASIWQRRRIRRARKATLNHARFITSLDVTMRNRLDQDNAAEHC